jgi:Phage tail tube protein
MARAYGSSAHLLMKRETTYGQAATGTYVRMPFNRCNLGSEQGLIDDPVLGQGRDPLAPLQDVINDEGDIVVPVDPRYLGLWLTGLFGDPDSNDNLDGSWDHEFASGGEDLPSYTIEVGMPKVPAFFLHAGVKLNSIALEFTRSGPAAATISAIAQGENAYGHAHQRPRRDGVLMMLPGRPVREHTRLTHRSALRLVPKSVDECNGRMTFAISLEQPAEERESVGAEGERRTQQSARRGRSSGSAGSPPSRLVARAGPAIARHNRAGAARRKIPADPARCNARHTAR